MRDILIFVFKAFRKIYKLIPYVYYKPINRVNLYLNGVAIGSNLIINGFLKVIVTRRGEFKIGNNVSINSGQNHNVIGRNQKTVFWVEGKLTIGNNTGLSSTAIICNYNIEIGNNVKIGGNTVIYDSDFHSLDPVIRRNTAQDKASAKKAKVIIKNNVFIGSHSTILKGVVIGENAVVGACSLVSRDIPENEIWGGNPIRFIRNVNEI